MIDDGIEILMQYKQFYNAPIEELLPVLRRFATQYGLTLGDVARGLYDYNEQVTPMRGNSEWWSPLAWLQAAVSGTKILHPEIDTSIWVNQTQLLAAQSAQANRIYTQWAAEGVFPTSLETALANYVQSNFDYRATAGIIRALANPFRGAPYFITENDLIAEIPVFGRQHFAQTQSKYTEGSNYRAIAARDVADTLTAKGFDGEAWYRTPEIQAVVQRGGVEGMARWQATQIPDDDMGPLLGIVIGIGVAVVTGGGGLLSLLGTSATDAALVGSFASAELGSAAITTAVDLASLASEAVTTLDAVNSVVSFTDPVIQATFDTVVDSTSLISESADAVVNVVQDAVDATFPDIPTVNDPTILQPSFPDIPTVNDPTILQPSFPDIPTVADPMVPQVPQLPTTAPNVQSVINTIRQAMPNISPTSALSLARTLYSTVTSGGNTTAIRNPGAQTAFGNSVNAFNSATPENNYGVGIDYSGLLGQVALPMALILGAIMISKR